MAQAPLDFAFRYWEAQPRRAGQWSDVTAEAYPPPPREWQTVDNGFSAPWHRCSASSTGGTTIQELDPSCEVRVREETSIAWCQESQSFWIAPLDLSDRRVWNGNASNWRDWSFLYFKPLTLGDNHAQRTYSVFPYGTDRQLDYACPGGFDEFLPRNKFTETQHGIPIQCKLVGRLSLILALHAMCPAEPGNIMNQISHFFWTTQHPFFEPTTEHGFWQPRNKYATPGRVLVMQTAICADYHTSETVLQQKEARLRQWENGLYGPMVSSRIPLPYGQHYQQAWS